MTLVKSLLLGSVAGFAAVAGAQAADLPSRKAAPVAYVKICDAYGAGFFYIPGTDTCLKVGGYARAEYQYTPGHAVYSYNTAAAPLGAANYLAQVSSAQSTTGYEVRGRVDLDARTPTALGTARTYIKLRLAATSGIRNATVANNSAYGFGDASATGPAIEAAMVQWAGFTFGVAPENYALMPTYFYNSMPWSTFTTGAKQIAYTAVFGGGISATIALEDRTDWGYSGGGSANGNYVQQARNAANIVGNIRIDQGWGWAALHGVVGNNTIASDYDVNGGGLNPGTTPFGVYPTYSSLIGQDSKGAWALGATAMFNLPMLAPGDRLYLTANYERGMLGAILTGGGMNVISSSVNKRFLGGIQRVDNNLVATGYVNGVNNTNGFTVGSTTGWNIAGAFTHYWAPQWRSNFQAGYVSISPPSSTFTEWGKGRLWDVAGSIIYSPVKDLDIGLEVQYASLRNKIQNPTQAFINAGSPGLSSNGIMTRLRVERTF